MNTGFPGYASLYRRGIMMNVTNPKVSLFFLAFLPHFCDPTKGSVALQVLSLGVIFMLGAEVNAALMKYRVYSALKHARQGQQNKAEVLGQTEKAADIGR